ncbi:MAG: beta-N-acetylhexosaminidase, partial [Gammaproteobacteria bacterium]|nr:beta-N-acetylhexosaminidase [Gammaproteobacteria bacterium]
MTTGPIMLDLDGTELSPEEIELIQHPNTGGVILFSRNFSDISQLQALTTKIKTLRKTELLIGVDHEGGRIQRFRQGFTRLPPCRVLGELYDEDRLEAVTMAETTGWLMAIELLAVGVDFSFAPVLDLDREKSQVIGDRAFHHSPDIVTDLARAYIKGMRKAGMEGVGKHFPGHGWVHEDSHIDVPKDPRSYEDIMLSDLIPFERLINAGISAIMPAHVIYEKIDNNPAGFSKIWLTSILREQMGFHGMIFSDDISMAGAVVQGTPLDRTISALEAGCDMVLICNNRKSVYEVLDN